MEKAYFNNICNLEDQNKLQKNKICLKNQKLETNKQQNTSDTKITIPIQPVQANNIHIKYDITNININGQYPQINKEQKVK